jgi:hypothetical protein
VKEDEDVSYGHLSFGTTLGADKEMIGREAARSSSTM